MKAIEFIKKFGWDYAKERLDYCKNARLVGMEIDLKRYVDAYELVQSYGGVKDAMKYANYIADISYRMYENTKQAIALVEEVGEF